jgi:RHS repeat-associated protein
VVQERDINNLPVVTYTRGNDLSGTLQGAGGIGGLLTRTVNSQMLIGAQFASAYYFCDAMGNISGLVYTNGLMAAQYTYDPFGNILTMSGPLASANTYRFSSKEWNDKPGTYYYGYRFYDPNLQRWINRDPVQELGGLNMYAFVRNAVMNVADRFGLCDKNTYLQNEQAYYASLIPPFPDAGRITDLSPQFLAAAPALSFSSSVLDIALGLSQSAAVGANDAALFSAQRYINWEDANPRWAGLLAATASYAAKKALDYQDNSVPALPSDRKEQFEALADFGYEAADKVAEYAGESESSNSSVGLSGNSYSGGGENLVQNASSPGSSSCFNN